MFVPDYKKFFEDCRYLLCVLDKNYRFLSVNSAFENILGFDANILPGNLFIDYLNPADSENTHKIFKNLSEEKKINFTLSFKSKDNTYKEISWNFNVEPVTGNIYATGFENANASLAQQIENELIAARTKAEEASKAKTRFLSTMSHEIRTPLSAIIGITHLLLNEKHEPEILAENLRTLNFSSQNLLVLINDILDFSKIEAGKITLEQLEFDLLETINRIKHSLTPLASEKGIVLKLRKDDLLPEKVIGDPLRLAQILNNLVSNAIKFTQSGNVTIDVKVSAETKKTTAIEFSVTDTGIGIPGSKISQIFEAFTQATAETTRNFGGTGLGLTITKKLLEMQNSHIRVESELGKGSRFYFTLVFGKTNHESTESTLSIGPVKQKYKSLKGIKVLLVEDNNINMLIAEKFLQKWGIEVDKAENGLIAVEKAAINIYDLIFMDLKMPELDGYEATKAIRAQSGDQNIIIALTASAMPDSKEKVLAAGMNDYIAKPFNPPALYNTILKYVPAEKISQ